LALSPSMHLDIASDISSPICAEPNSSVGGFREGARYRIACVGSSAVNLLIDEELLPSEVSGGQRYWLWTPGFYAGQVDVQLRHPDGSTWESYQFDVSPHENKLGKDEFAAMVAELCTFRKALLLGTEPSRISIGSDGSFESINLWYGRLRQYGEVFLQALDRIKEHPLKKSLRTRLVAPANRARRIDQQTMRAAANSVAISYIKGSFQGEGPIHPPMLDVPSYMETLDIAANQTLTYFLHAVLARVRWVTEELQRLSKTSIANSARTELATRWPERSRFLSELESALRKMDRCSPFTDVSNRNVTAAGLNAISASPLYGRAHRLAWFILRSGISGDATSESQWMSPSWEIYERWSFLKIVHIVSEIADVAEAQIDFGFRGDDTITATLKNEVATYEVCLQDKFPAYSAKAINGKSSISGERYPDITIVRTPANEGTRDWICLDAKYRVSRQGVLEAMASAHLYHDALRIDGKPPALSALLTPDTAEAEWLTQQEFINREKVGVLSTKKLAMIKLVIQNIFNA